MLVDSGAASMQDLKDIYKYSIDKKIKSLPDIDGLSKETILNSWLSKFDQIIRGSEEDMVASKKSAATISSRLQSSLNANLSSELILSKEQLYDMFQHVLTIKKFEHQLLFNALQVGR